MRSFFKKKIRAKNNNNQMQEETKCSYHSRTRVKSISVLQIQSLIARQKKTTNPNNASNSCNFVFAFTGSNRANRLTQITRESSP